MAYADDDDDDDDDDDECMNVCMYVCMYVCVIGLGCMRRFSQPWCSFVLEPTMVCACQLYTSVDKYTNTSTPVLRLSVERMVVPALGAAHQHYTLLLEGPRRWPLGPGLLNPRSPCRADGVLGSHGGLGRLR